MSQAGFPPPPPGFPGAPPGSGGAPARSDAPSGAAAGAPPTRLKIFISGWGRTVALTKTAFVTLFGITFLVLAADHDLGKSNDYFNSRSMSPDEIAATRGTLVAFGLACLWVAWLTVRPGIARKAYLELTPDALVVVHSGLLTAPMSIPRETVKAASIDPRAWRWRWGR